MPGREDVLVMCASAETRLELPRGLRRLRETGTCEFGGETVIYNRNNISELRSKGKNPVLICASCYSRGEHVKAGYRKA